MIAPLSLVRPLPTGKIELQAMHGRDRIAATLDAPVHFRKNAGPMSRRAISINHFAIGFGHDPSPRFKTGAETECSDDGASIALDHRSFFLSPL
jgi:hypothetical protein